MPITTLKGVGPKVAEKLQRLSINNLADLLFHLPFRYQDRTKITPIGSLQVFQDAVIEGEVLASSVVYGRRRSLLVKFADSTGLVNLRFYYFNKAQQRMLSKGTQLRCYGEVRRGASGMEFYHPEFRRLDDNDELENSLTPIYPATEGFSQQQIRKLIKQALQLLHPGSLPELLPEQARRLLSQVTLEDALLYLHHPPTDANQLQLLEGTHPCQQRLAFEELLAHNLSMKKVRRSYLAEQAPLFKQQQSLADQFTAALPFALTSAQQRVYKELLEDMAKALPMHRLVQGDVGSGKTVVAALAALSAVQAGYQVAIMAPTEILAEQHLLNFSNWLIPLGLEPGWLSGKVKGKKRQSSLAAIANGQSQVVIGTHALFQADVEFHNLGLVIIDEQHRFGVQQRLALRKKGPPGVTPHQLVMTATPIPRTLAMTAYADLDVSIIDELPPGRTPVNTVALSDSQRDRIVERVASACSEGKQAYWVCTLIEESEELECQAAENTAELLAKALPQLKVGLVHGRLKAAEKAEVMDAFKKAEIHLLVATTVIEVGVDVPNASLMVIENPERLGLSQLHQLRGRVGRGSTESHCVLMYKQPLSQQSRERIDIMRSTNDGFVIAEEDLKLRGPGELLGTRQTGEMLFRIADLQRDAELIEKVQGVAEMIEGDAALVDVLIERWIPDAVEFAKA